MADLTKGQYKKLLVEGKADLLTQIMGGETTLEAAGLAEAVAEEAVAETIPVAAEVEPVPEVVEEEPKKKVSKSSKKLRGLVRRR